MSKEAPQPEPELPRPAEGAQRVPSKPSKSKPNRANLRPPHANVGEGATPVEPNVDPMEAGAAFGPRVGLS